LSALITAGLSAGCGGSSPAEVTPDLEGCAAAWQEIYGPRPELAPNQILAHGDHLYFNDTSSTTGNTGVIVSVPALGGDATLVSPDTGAFLWAEGGNLLYAPWGDRLQAVPFSGGATMLLQDGGFCGARIGGTCDGVLLDDAFLYFNSFTPTGQGPGGDVVFTRMSRAAGTDEDLATLSGGAPTSLTRLAGDSLLVFLAGRGYVIPRAGEQPRALADQPGGGVVGLDDQGLLSSWLLPAATSAMKRTPIDGGPLVPLWSEKPARFRPAVVSPDPAGGWVVTGHEPFADGATHVSVWWLDARENGRRVACHAGASDAPGSSSDLPGVITVGSDAIYATVNHLPSTGSPSWGIVRIARSD